MSKQEVEGSSNSAVRFQENEKVLCHHQRLIYEGKILSVRKQLHEKEEIFYLIHYAGWSKKWDEYVPASRLLKYTEDNLKLQTELKAQQVAARRGRKSTLTSGKSVGPNKKNNSQGVGDSLNHSDTDLSRPTTPTTAEQHPVPSGKREDSNQKSKLPSTLNNPKPKQALDQAEFDALMPDKVKQILLHDYDRIRRRKMLLVLPARNTISDVLAGFLQYLGKETPAHLTCAQVLKDNITYGLFNRLLYQEEQEQFRTVVRCFEDSRSPDDDPKFDTFLLLSKIYGPYHLMRLCSKIGRIITSTAEADDIPFDTFKVFLNGLYGYIVSRLDDLFIPELDYVA